jgi:DNA-binding NtrC family response regulator
VHRSKPAPWPGNVRQLKHCIERAVALHPGGPIDAAHLFAAGESVADTRFVAAPGGETALRYQDARADFERDFFRRLLDAAPGQHIRGGASERHPAAESLCTHQALGNCH